MSLLEQFTATVEATLGAQVASVASASHPDATANPLAEQDGRVGRTSSVEQGASRGACHLPPMTADQQADIREVIDERAAILEYEAGTLRPEAEARAVGAMRVYRYRLTDRPADWLVMIAPGCDLDAARRTLIARFGNERLLEVQIHRPEVMP
ncbi:hypothetical protein [Thiocystis violacea]|uniref:hypothetical protein n=1 Tax=Thiocystis violacea TaxID=13725 RepID=UPI0019036FAB|nr:hypothetical protein [Thiocystis violacea]